MSDVLKTAEEKMEKTLRALGSEYDSIRAGRANPHVLDQITVDYYGSPCNIQSVANVSVPEPRMLVIAPWDKKMIKTITKAIQVSDLGINPSDDGSVIRLVFPEMTEERRKVLAKDVKKKGDQAKVAVRNIRRDLMDSLKKQNKAGEISEDEQKTLEEKLQKVTDKYIAKVDKEIDSKSKEIMTV